MINKRLLAIGLLLLLMLAVMAGGESVAETDASASTHDALSVDRSTTELGEGTIRKVYVDKPLLGLKGYILGNWKKGIVRIEVFNFPEHSLGYEAFLFQIDNVKYRNAMFVDGNPDKGIVPNPPPFETAAGLIKKWKSIGTISVDDQGRGTLEYVKGDDLYNQDLNMVFILAKVTDGQHGGPEDMSLLMVECNGALPGTKGSGVGEVMPLTVFPKAWKK